MTFRIFAIVVFAWPIITLGDQSNAPSVAPSVSTIAPSITPTNAPSIAPSLQTNAPSISPSNIPTVAPTASSNAPTQTPSGLTNAPTYGPTIGPSIAPSTAPTNSPSMPPTSSSNPPTMTPSAATNPPSVAPSTQTNAPTIAPSSSTNVPSVAPSASTDVPTITPSVSTNPPSIAPTSSTHAPSMPPTTQTNAPSVAPTSSTNAPTKAPSAQTNAPTKRPTPAPKCSTPSVLPFENDAAALAYIKYYDEECFYQYWKPRSIYGGETGFHQMFGPSGHIFNESTMWEYLGDAKTLIHGYGKYRKQNLDHFTLMSVTTMPYDHELLTLFMGGYGVAYKSKVDVMYGDDVSTIQTIEAFTSKTWFKDDSGILAIDMHISNSLDMDDVAVVICKDDIIPDP